MKTQYDPAVIQDFADSLYAHARTVIITYGLVGLIAGAALGLMIAVALKPEKKEAVIGGGAAALAIVGISVGRGKAFQLRLQAQLALCQMKVEENTRGKGVEQPQPAPTRM